jgi:membrane protein
VIQLIADQVTRIASQSNDKLGIAFLVGLGISLWSANSGMAALFDALNVVYGEKEKRSILHFYGTTFLFTLGSIAFVLIAITGVIVLPIVLKFFGSSTTAEQLLAILRWPVLLLGVMLGLACVYRWGPSRNDAKWRWVTPGSVLAAMLWIAASMVFSAYVANFDSYNRTYGSLGAGIGFMSWIWISAVIVLLGGELNAEMEHQTAQDTTEGRPKPLGTRGAHMADHVGASQD